MKLKLLVLSMTVAGAMATSSLALAAAADLDKCCTPGDKDFPKVGGNLGNQAYSSLMQINKDNVGILGPIWQTHVSAVPPATTDAGQQTTPIVVDGVIYLDTPNGDVIAIDGKTGATKWKWHPTDFAPTATRRGVSVGDGKVYTLASGNRVVALDKNTGAQVWVVQPTGPGGASLGNTQKVATTYYEGKVYIGTNDANRNAGYAVNSSDGSMIWSFYGGAAPGTVHTDVNGKVINAGASWGEGNTCALTAGVSTWIHPAIDPELGMVYWAYGNVRSCGSSQDGSGRPGDNLFADSMVALDDKTGEYKWHFQTNHHDIWDMDNTHPPVLADVMINGEMRKVIYQGSKSGMNFVYDRTNGKPVLGIEERAVATDSRQAMSPTQPWPIQPPWIPQCVVYQQLGTEIPGDPNRAVPNYNGYQPDAQGRLVYTEPNYLDADKPFVTYPPGYGATHRKGCLRDPHWDLPILSTPSQNGGADWAGYSFSQKLGLLYVGYGTNPSAHDRGEGGNGLRAIGQYQTGGMVAIDGSTNLVRWRKEFGLDAAHGDGVLTTASDLLFKGLPDGNFFALDAANGKELWRFQTGAAISAAPITYTIDGEQYVAIFSAGTGIPYGNSVTNGDSLWAFKIGGAYKTASGSSEAPTPAPLVIRRPVGGNAVEGSTVDNTIYLARASRTTDTAAARDGVATGAMNPTFLRVPVGTTVTFLNPGAAQFPNFPNEKLHCATQFFEGLFNPKLNPGESFKYTFTREGEYFYNDCTDPRPTGKVVAYHVPQDLPGALGFTESPLKLGVPTRFAPVGETVTATFRIPQGYKIDGDVKLTAPLSETPISPAAWHVTQNGRLLVAKFRKGDLDNNVPVGDAVPLVLTANFMNGGAQKQLTSSTKVKIVK